jgi:hypothetical protein
MGGGVSPHSLKKVKGGMVLTLNFKKKLYHRGAKREGETTSKARR